MMLCRISMMTMVILGLGLAKAVLADRRTNTAGVRLCDSPSSWNDPSHYVLLASGTALRKLETNNAEWIRVEVTGGPHGGRRGWIMAHFFEGD